MFDGIRIIQTASALKDTSEPNFPPSRHRSKRIHKKLLKRHGYKQEPAIWQVGDVIYGHPVLYRQIQAELARRISDDMDALMLRTMLGY